MFSIAAFKALREDVERGQQGRFADADDDSAAFKALREEMERGRQDRLANADADSGLFAQVAGLGDIIAEQPGAACSGLLRSACASITALITDNFLPSDLASWFLPSEFPPATADPGYDIPLYVAFYMTLLLATVRRAYAMIKSFFTEAHPGVLMKHGRPLPEADLDHLCGKVLLAFKSMQEQYERDFISSQTSTLALCYLRKREVMKVVRGELPIHCVIMHTSEATYAVPTPVDTDQQDHFLLRLEVDDPDDPVNNPSLFFVVPKSEAGFYDTSEFNGWLECERWIRKLSGDSSNANFHVLIAIHPSCLTGDCGHALGRKKGKKCTGCRRVVYCSKECQKVDWKEHKPGCNKTLQEIQLEESALVHTPDHIGYTGRGGMVRSQLCRSRSRGSSQNRGKIAAWLPSGRIELATCD
eukprot:gene6995-1644_t